jgi:SAM-dependent methyltransferase
MSAETPRPRWFTDTKDDHSQWFIDRFRAMEAQGADLLGEARFVDMMAPRGARIVDAGCGLGRTAAALHEAGHEAYGLDVDPALIEAAQLDHPGPTYAVVDLAELTLRDVGDMPVDLVVCGGNVMVFLAPGTELRVLRNMCQVVFPGGRVVVGFRREETYPFEAYDADLAALEAEGVAAVEARYATWHLDPFEGGDFAVTVLRVL